jgi:hypothetical protein
MPASLSGLASINLELRLLRQTCLHLLVSVVGNPARNPSLFSSEASSTHPFVFNPTRRLHQTQYNKKGGNMLRVAEPPVICQKRKENKRRKEICSKSLSGKLAMV